MWAMVVEKAGVKNGENWDFIWYFRESTKAFIPALTQEQTLLTQF